MFAQDPARFGNAQHLSLSLSLSLLNRQLDRIISGEIGFPDRRQSAGERRLVCVLGDVKRVFSKSLSLKFLYMLSLLM